MDVLPTEIDLNSAEFQANARAMQALVDDWRARVAAVKAGGGPDAVAKHKARGKMTARERIDALVDEGSSFLEFSTLAALDLYDGAAPGAGLVDRHWVDPRASLRDRRKRCDGQRRHLFPYDRQEAPAGAGNRFGERPALRLPRRQRRRFLAHAG